MDRKQKQLEAYQKCVNSIDDLLEYRYKNLTKQTLRDTILLNLSILSLNLVEIERASKDNE